MPSVQIASFPVTDAASNPDNFKAPLDKLKAADGHVSSYYGTQTEDASRAYFISVWESHEHHQKLIDDPNYTSLIEGLRPGSADTQFQRHRFNVSGDVSKALSAPAIEIVLWTLKAGAPVDKFESLMGELAKGLDTAAGEHPPCAWGQTTEDKNKYQLIVGWDTVAAHWEAVKEGTELHKTVKALLEHADLTIGHTLSRKL